MMLNAEKSHSATGAHAASINLRVNATESEMNNEIKKQ